MRLGPIELPSHALHAGVRLAFGRFPGVREVALRALQPVYLVALFPFRRVQGQGVPSEQDDLLRNTAAYNDAAERYYANCSDPTFLLNKPFSEPSLFAKHLIVRIGTLALVLLSAAGASADEDFARFVNPFVGTAGPGHTFPGATVPFGLVQLSPDTRTDGWHAASGYHDADRHIIGFSHTHLSGTGVSDYADILLMPTIDDRHLNPGDVGMPDRGYRSRFLKKDEAASPGYYRVRLRDYDVLAELTATTRVGVHRYTFPETGDARIILDLRHRRDELSSRGAIQVLSSTEIQGYRVSRGWAQDQPVFFHAEFSQPFSYELVDLAARRRPRGRREIAGDDVRGMFYFDQRRQGRQVLVKVGISAVSMEAARQNLRAEVDDWDFDRVHREARASWNAELNKIAVELPSEARMVVFYTALYHSLIAPNTFMDVDRGYRGIDGRRHVAETHSNYTVFSLWDTFRALHPLLTITHRALTADLVETLLNHYRHSGSLPVWELWANDTNTMIGYPAVPVIVDAILKGIAVDTATAYEAVRHSAMQDHRGLGDYKRLGYVPSDREPESVSKTLEYAYEDWVIAQLAARLGKHSDYNYFSERGASYQNVFDPETRFMRPRESSGRWAPDFDPLNSEHRTNGYTEANAWQYSWFVPHNVADLVDLFGGPDAFEQKLDRLFTLDSDVAGERSVDISGLIGQYAHGNEPSHHIAYLYNYIGKPHKTQDRVRQIMDDLYGPEADGLSGNDDCGQLSAWFVLSSLGLYQVAPGDGRFMFGSPLVRRAVIQLESGRTFVIRTEGDVERQHRVARVWLNNRQVDGLSIAYDDVMAGGELVFELQ
ncbi:MAG: GH92 family glycosyl hydrolase [Acidobacteria bacterium]|nr:GH92 family glycosyl hydrolase [Acidobacteriota bacterium]